MPDASLTITLRLWWLWAYLAVGLAFLPWYAVRVWRAGSESRRLSFWRWASVGLFPDRPWQHRLRWATTWLLWPLALWEELL